MAIERGKSARKRAAPTGAKRVTHDASARSSSSPAARTKPRSSVKHNNRPSKAWTYSRRGYALAQGFRQLRVRKLASLTTLLVFGITLALPALILFTASSLAELGNKSVGDESVTAYLSLQIPDLEGAALAQQLHNETGVKQARYVSRDEALAIFQSQADIGEAIAVLGENPLPGAIIIYPDTSALSESAIQALANRIEAIDEVDRVQFDLRWVQRLQAVLNLGRTIGWILAGFLTLSALLVIGNTIRLELLRRQTEMDVSRLLGASQSFLNRPMLYTGALYGLIGGLIACAIALLALHALRSPAAELSRLYSSAFELIMPTATQLVMVIATATVLGLFGAIITIYQPSNHFLQNRRKGI